MKTILTAVTAVSALMAAAPAAAQYNYQSNVNANGAVGTDNRIARIEARIEAGIQSGAIDEREARNLRWQLRQITRLDQQYSRNGYTQAERADLQQRLRTFRDQLRMADGGSNGYGQYGNNGYGNNGYNSQYGNGQNGYYGRGGPYEDVSCDTGSRGGLGGLFDSIFGGAAVDNCSGLRVGQRATGNLGSVPYQYRSQYRDGSGYYYRSDGQTIYQIDARTNTVARVYPMNR